MQQNVKGCLYTHTYTYLLPTHKKITFVCQIASHHLISNAAILLLCFILFYFFRRRRTPSTIFIFPATQHNTFLLPHHIVYTSLYVYIQSFYYNVCRLYVRHTRHNEIKICTRGFIWSVYVHFYYPWNIFYVNHIH